MCDDCAKLRDQLNRAKEALAMHQAWADSERDGPNYGVQTRDTHPEGERIWRQWWDGNLSLCAKASDATYAILAELRRDAGESIKHRETEGAL